MPAQDSSSTGQFPSIAMLQVRLASHRRREQAPL
jgi:hypothetical protein